MAKEIVASVCTHCNFVETYFNKEAVDKERQLKGFNEDQCPICGSSDWEFAILELKNG